MKLRGSEVKESKVAGRVPTFSCRLEVRMCHAPVTGGVRYLPKSQGNEREAQTLYVCFGAMKDVVPSRNAENKEQRRCFVR
jgi:hypothetical protein